jgi:hypothetical protein
LYYYANDALCLRVFIGETYACVLEALQTRLGLRAGM